VSIILFSKFHKDAIGLPAELSENTIGWFIHTVGDGGFVIITGVLTVSILIE